MIRALVRASALMAALVAGMSTAKAQLPEPPGCAEAASAVRARTSADRYGLGLRELIGCPQTGPRALAEEWARGPIDKASVKALAGASGTLRDRRVHAALERAALDETQPQWVRLAALQALVRHYDPSLAVEFRESPPGHAGRIFVMLGSWTGDPIEGSEPLGPETRSAVLAALETLGQSSDTTIGRIAVDLAKRLPR